MIVAEFNFQSDFRDRTGSLESLLVSAQQLAAVKVIVYYEQQHAHQLAKLQARFPDVEAMAYPIEPGRLAASLASGAVG